MINRLSGLLIGGRLKIRRRGQALPVVPRFNVSTPTQDSFYQLDWKDVGP